VEISAHPNDLTRGWEPASCWTAILIYNQSDFMEALIRPDGYK
jgi:hypothetical protein